MSTTTETKQAPNLVRPPVPMRTGPSPARRGNQHMRTRINLLSVPNISVRIPNQSAPVSAPNQSAPVSAPNQSAPVSALNSGAPVVNETKERETKEQPSENKEEELKIATPEEIKEAKHLAAIRSLVSNYEQDLLDDIKNKVDIINGRIVDNGHYVDKRCVRILKTISTNDKTILAYMTYIHGFTDYKEENVIYSTISGHIYNHYSFKTTLEEDYKYHKTEARKKRKLLDDIDKDISVVLLEKRRRLA